MAYKSVGTFDTETLAEIYDDITIVLEEIAGRNTDMTVVEMGMADDPDAEPELWHNDYDAGDGAWSEAGEFEDIHAASDAAGGCPEGTAIGVFDYADATAKLMVREADDG